jgi:hypothetical protein
MGSLQDTASSGQTAQRFAVGTALLLALLTVSGTVLNSLPLRTVNLCLGLALLAVVTVLVNAAIASRSANRDSRMKVAQLRQLLNTWPPRAPKDMSPYVLGVRSPGAAIARGKLFPAYVRRDVDPAVRDAIESAPIALLVGPLCAGKSRTAFEALASCERTAESLVLAPDDNQALAELLAAPGCVLERGRRYVLWLDDVDRFLDTLRLRDLDSFIRAADSHGNGATELTGVIVVATLRDDVFLEVINGGGDKAHVLRGLVARAERVVVPAKLSTAEQERLADAYPDAPRGASFREVFGETMVQLGHPIYRALPPAPGKARRRRSLSPSMAAVLAAGLTAAVLFAGFESGWTTPPPLAKRFDSLASADDACGGVGVSPNAAAAVQRDVVRVIHRGDGCSESDVVQVFRRDGDTLSAEPAAAFQPSSTQKALFQCLGPDTTDPCHPDVFGGKRIIVGAWQDPVSQQRMPIAIYPSGEGYEMVGLDLDSPQAATVDRPQSPFAQPTSLVLVNAVSGRRSTVQGSPATVALMLPPRESGGAMLVAGYAVGQRLNRPEIVARGFELGLKDRRVVVHRVCKGKKRSGLRFRAPSDGNPTSELRRRWLRAEAAHRVACPTT